MTLCWLPHHQRCSSLKCSVAQQGIVTASKIDSKKTDFFNRLTCFRNTESNDSALLEFNNLERNRGEGFWSVFN